MIHIDRSQTHEMWKFGLRRRAIPFLGIHKLKFLCSVRIFISEVVSRTYLQYKELVFILF